MFISLDFFGLDSGAVFKTRLCHPNYNSVEISNMVLDQIYIDEDITIPYSTTKPDDWNYRTVLNAKLQNNLEGGSISAGGLIIEKVRFQRRRIDELMWQDIEQIPYKPGEQILYEAIDKYIQNDFGYQYSIIPLTATVMGNRVTSSEITAGFEGVFISDNNNNYRLYYDIELGEITHNTPSTTLEPLNSQFPIVSYSNLDYRTGDITALFLSASTVNKNGEVDIRMEKLGREQLLKFMKNRKPKFIRFPNGESMLVSLNGNPKESPNNNINGLATLSFSYTEIGGIDSKTLAENGLIEGLEEVY